MKDVYVCMYVALSQFALCWHLANGNFRTWFEDPDAEGDMQLCKYWIFLFYIFKYNRSIWHGINFMTYNRIIVEISFQRRIIIKKKKNIIVEISGPATLCVEYNHGCCKSSVQCQCRININHMLSPLKHY